MLRLTFASSLASQVLPLKLGELTYVYLLKRDNRASISHGLSSLMIMRLIDLLAVSLLFIIFTITVQVPAGLTVYFKSILGFMALLLLIILFVISSLHSNKLNMPFVESGGTNITSAGTGYLS